MTAPYGVVGVGGVVNRAFGSVERAAEPGHRGGDVEVRRGDPALQRPAGAGPVQPDHRDTVELVLDGVERAAHDQQAVAVGQHGRAQVHLRGPAGGPVDPEQVAGRGLDHQQRPVVRGLRDAVGVEAGGLLPLPR